MVSVLSLQAGNGLIGKHTKSVFVGCEDPEKLLPGDEEDHRNRGAGSDRRGAAPQELVPEGHRKTLTQGKTKAKIPPVKILI